jgi:hypothetical protein
MLRAIGLPFALVWHVHFNKGEDMLPIAASLLFQEEEVPTGFVAAFLAAYFLFILIGWLFFGFCLMKIAQKTNTENGWWGFVPILNIVLMLNIARKPIWWIILMLIPIVNIVVGIIVFMGIAEARGKPSWWGILMIVPLVNIVILVMLAFTD